MPSTTWRSFAPDTRPGYAGLYVNEGYQSIADGVRGGTLDLMPIKGAKFLWSLSIPASGALSCIQSDLRHRIARAPGTTFLDKHNAVRLQTIIRCDEGGWVRVDDLVRNEILWTHRIRELTASAAIRDEVQRSRIYNERLQLLIDGNYRQTAQGRKDKIAISR